jgi:site-specific DNA-methyltransferase (adenine-specific)
VETNKLTCGDAVSFLESLPPEMANLHLFSPPYDEIRDYDGNHSFEYTKVAPLMFQSLRNGGVAAMIIQDKISGTMSGTSIRAANAFLDAGFRQFHHCVYSRHGVPGKWWNKTLRIDHEHIFLFVKGDYPRVFNKEILKVPALHAGKRWNKSTRRKTSGELVNMGDRVQSETKCRGTIWHYNTNHRTQDEIKRRHPATFPEDLALDIIKGFTTEGDLVVDAYIGSGTTAWAAIKLNRRYLGNDINQEYLNNAQERINGITNV